MTELKARPASPRRAFPDGRWEDWREHVLDVDIAALRAAVIAERVTGLLDRLRASGKNLRDIADGAQISKSALSNVSRCVQYLKDDIPARLEEAYSIDLAPGDEIRTTQIVAYRACTDALRARIAELEADLLCCATSGDLAWVAELEARNAALAARIAELEFENARLRRAG